MKKAPRLAREYSPIARRGTVYLLSHFPHADSVSQALTTWPFLTRLERRFSGDTLTVRYSEELGQTVFALNGASF